MYYICIFKCLYVLVYIYIVRVEFLNDAGGKNLVIL